MGRQRFTPEQIIAKLREVDDGRYHRAGQGLRPLWLSPHPCSSGACWLAGQPVGGRADLAAGGSQSSEEATETTSTMAGRWIVHPAAPTASWARVVL